ncbi:hypothetical protein MCHI_004054 [Candidatus Magnetoovum chiemensis]|nr:hypothetical protein MCHI_004054 [Candidatus Magnetoovum chiemensis]
MTIISQDSVDKTWQQIANYSFDEAGKEMTSMVNAQPELLAFIYGLSFDLNPEAKETIVYMIFIIYTMYLNNGGKIKQITEQEIDTYYNAKEKEIDKFKILDENMLEQIFADSFSAQPFVIEFITDALMEDPIDNENDSLTDEDKSYIFLIILVVIGVFENKTKN